MTILGLQRDLPATGSPAPEQIVLSLAGAHFLHDVRHGAGWGNSETPRLTLDGVTPALLAIADAPPAPPLLAAPAQARAGETAELRITLPAGAATARVLHVAVTDPAGRAAPLYGGNIVVRGDTAVWSLPFAASDPAGRWTVAVHDVLAGGSVSATLDVASP